MYEHELLYGVSSIAIAVILFVAIVLFNEIGFRAGRFIQSHTDSDVKVLTGSIQASILGLLALLLGFTFSMSMQRYDNRSMALIDEANAIGTAVLRVQLLPDEYRKDANKLFQEYVNLRVSIGKLDLTKLDERNFNNNKISDLQNALWSLAISATNDDPRPVTTGAFVKSLNDVIDSQGKRNALLPGNARARSSLSTTIYCLYFIWRDNGLFRRAKWQTCYCANNIGFFINYIDRFHHY